jgi:hypothetical protein
MGKVVVSFRKSSYVVDAEVGIKVVELLSNAEIYINKYEAGKPSKHHIFSPSMKDILYGEVTVKSLPTNLYELAKLAGEPDD